VNKFWSDYCSLFKNSNILTMAMGVALLVQGYTNKRLNLYFVSLVRIYSFGIPNLCIISHIELYVSVKHMPVVYVLKDGISVKADKVLALHFLGIGWNRTANKDN
jgi:hypothetical protein